MFNKKNIFLFVLGLFVSTNSFTEVSTVKASYYKENKWDFMEDIFINKVNSTKTSFDKYKKIFAIAPLALSSSIFFSDEKTKFKWEFFFQAAFVLYILVDMPAFMIFTKLTEGKKRNEQIAKVLVDFFENYSDEKKVESSKVNYRDFIPEEYVNIFDSVYKEYKSGNIEVLCSLLSIVYKIRDKIIYDIKLEKYREPIVVNNSSYVHVVR